MPLMAGSAPLQWRSSHKHHDAPLEWRAPSKDETTTLVTHLLFQVLVDPDAGVDRAGTQRADAELAAIVLHPRPPGAVNVRRRQPDIGRVGHDPGRQLAQH